MTDAHTQSLIPFMRYGSVSLLVIGTLVILGIVIFMIEIKDGSQGQDVLPPLRSMNHQQGHEIINRMETLNNEMMAWCQGGFSPHVRFDDFLPPRPPHCPDKYLATYHYASLNNHVMLLTKAILLGALMNRTVILPEGYPLTELFDFSQVCVVPSVPAPVTEWVKNAKEVKSFVYHYVDWPSNYKHFKTAIFRANDALSFQHAEQTFTAQCPAASIPPELIKNDKLIFFPLLFYLVANKEMHVEVMKQFAISKRYVEIGDSFLRKHHLKEFAAIHTRNLNGLCAGFANTFIAKGWANDLHEYCSMKWSFIEAKFRSIDVDINAVPVFYATDGQNETIDARIMSRENVIRFDMHKEAEHLNIAVLEMYILSQSSWFLGNPSSTFATNVAFWREGLYHRHWSTNLLSGYTANDTLCYTLKPRKY